MQMIRMGYKLWKLLACTVKVHISQTQSGAYCRLKGRAYIGEVLIQVWLQFIKK